MEARWGRVYARNHTHDAALPCWAGGQGTEKRGARIRSNPPIAALEL